MRIQFGCFVYFVLLGCTLTEKEQDALKAPSYFPTPTPAPTSIATRKEIVHLGKMLFHDPILSEDSSISCASCHNIAYGLSDHPKQFSQGVSGKNGTRNAPPLFNLAWSTSFFWDGGSYDLESQLLVPITDQDEMHQDLNTLLRKLSNNKKYQSNFQKAFGTDSITTKLVMVAIAHYERTIISCRSRYDEYLSGKRPLSDSEMKGMLLVKKHCSGCHAGTLFTDQSFHNNGLDSSFPNMRTDFQNPHLGRARVTHKMQDLGKYKTPTLRNVFLTSPYMHDGRFSNLDQVLDHYISGIKHSNTLDSVFLNKGNRGIGLDTKEKKQIIDFIKTLTDSSLIKDVRFKL